MNVVGHTVDGDELVSLVLNDAGHVAIQVVSPGRLDETVPVFNGENGLNIELGIGICHWGFFGQDKMICAK